MNEYPYNDRELRDRKGEVWKDLPKLEGYFLISNFGRLKRSARKLAGKTLPELIISQTISRSYNAFTKDYKVFLRATISLNKKIHNLAPARLVYYCFVETFNLEDKNIFIFYKDNNSLNIVPENLILGDQKEKQKRLETSGRKENVFSKITPARRNQIQLKINQAKSKNSANEISKYSLSGKLMATFHNAEMAAKTMKTSASTISKAARGVLLTCRGYFWRRGRQEEIDLSELKTIKGIYRSPAVKHIKRIGQYQADGILVQTFCTIKEASMSTKIPYSNLTGALSMKRLSAGGYLWRYDTKSKINIKALSNIPGYRYSPISAIERKISSYDFKGIWQATYANIAEAAKKTKVDSKSISMAIKKKLISAGGKLWQEGTSLRINPQKLKQLPAYKNSALERFNKTKESSVMKEKRAHVK